MVAVQELSIISNGSHEHVKFDQFSWNCRCSHFLVLALGGLLVHVGFKFELQSLFLILETAVEKIISSPGPFSSLFHLLMRQISLF